MTTGGLPSLKQYKYCSFLEDHYSQFVYITMHEKKHAMEQVCSKLEFKDFATRFGVQIMVCTPPNCFRSLDSKSNNSSPFAQSMLTGKMEELSAL